MPRTRAAAATLLLILSPLPLTGCAPDDAEGDGEATPTGGIADGDGAQGETPGEDTDDTDGGDTDDESGQSPSPTDGPDAGTAPGGVPAVEDAELPGQSVATYYSGPGDEAAVIAVSHDDVLNIRALPGAWEDQISDVSAADTVELAGRERLLGSNPWAEITLEDGVGWVNSYYLAYPGPEEDVTEDYADISPATVPRAVVDTVGTRAAAESRTESVPTYRTISEAPEESEESGQDADEQRWSIDLTSPGDDAVRGHRLTVELVREDEAYVLESVTSTPLCHRGASDEGCL